VSEAAPALIKKSDIVVSLSQSIVSSATPWIVPLLGPTIR
jgi:hypothetical protein